MKRLMTTAVTMITAGWTFAACEVREETVELKTYPYSDPDPVPATEMTRYPYFFIDGTTNASEMRKWKAVILENDKVKVTILPEVGGKIWGAVDKKSGKEFIYYNHVVKFRNIAQRGPWCSGGIEFNFGIIGHGPWTAAPVSYVTRKNADGSVSCFVSETELVTRSTWQVEINLPPDAEGFLTKTTWYNGSGFTMPYYQWMNAAYSVRGNPTFEYPGKAYIGHGGDTHDWPIDPDGHNLAAFTGNAFGGPKSEHIVEGDNGIYGIWWHDWNIGSAHLSHVTQKYGRKVWLWSLSRNGGIWEDLLTDTDGQYTELQSGRAFNQPQKNSYLTPFKHLAFAPGVTDTFEEEWRVVRDRAFFEKAWNEKNYSHRPQRMPADFDWESVYGLYLTGEQLLRTRFDREGEAALKRCLEKDRYYVPAMNLLASLFVRRGEYAKARQMAARALAINTYEPEANYADGLAAFAQGDFHLAKERLGLAAYSPYFRAAGFAKVAQIELRELNFDVACAMADKALAADALNQDALLVKIVAARLAGDHRKAAARALAMLVKLPLCHPARYELNLAEPSTPFERLIQNEMPQETYLEIGTWYEEAGLYADAANLFARAGKNTIVGTIRAAYSKHLLKDETTAENLLAEAARQTVAFAFPFRRETLPALAWAVAKNPSWKFKYLNAVLFSSFAHDEEAKNELDAVGNAADESVFYLFRAKSRLGDARLADLRQAAKTGDSWRVGLAIYRYFADKNQWANALAVLKDYITRTDSNKLRIAYATALVKNRKNREAIAYLEKTEFLPSEHGENAAAAWIDAWAALANEALAKGDRATAVDCVRKAISHPERLGLGRPYKISFKPAKGSYSRNAFSDWSEELRAIAEELERKEK